jgi:hypothetical protein
VLRRAPQTRLCVRRASAELGTIKSPALYRPAKRPLLGPTEHPDWPRPERAGAFSRPVGKGHRPRTSSDSSVRQSPCIESRTAKDSLTRFPVFGR